MIAGNDVICFCNDWDGDPLSKKQIVTRLAVKNRVLWVNSTGTRNPTVSAHDFKRAWKKICDFCHGSRQVATNIWLFCPLVIPFHGSRVARWFNRRLLAWSLRRTLRRLAFHQPITLTFVPSSADVAGSLGERLLVYYCVDEYSEFSGTDKVAILELERTLIEKSDVVIVSADRLYETKRTYNANTFLLPHGVDVEHFRRACMPETPIPEDCRSLNGLVVGFFGLIADWVDLEVVRYLACARPDWSLLLIGEVRTDVSMIERLPNVKLLGRRPYQLLPGYCKKFDVAILPFKLNELTLAANPLKLREYLAAGLPVIATPLPEVKKLGGLVLCAGAARDYLEQIESLQRAGRRGPDLSVSYQMDAESWDGRVEAFSSIINAHCDASVHRRMKAARQVA